MNRVQPYLTQNNIEFDKTVGASASNSSAPSSEKKESLADSQFLPQERTPGIGNANHSPASVTTDLICLPRDTIVAIGQHIRLQDLPRLFSMNRALNALYREDKIVYAKSFCKIVSALRFPEIKEALTAITQYTADKQPYLLRTLAEKIRMQTDGPIYGAISEWQDRIDAQFDWHAAQAPGHERELALQQLIIARGLALTECQCSRNGEPLHSIIGDRLDKLPPDYWPPIFEAFLPGGDVGKLLWMCKFKERFEGNIPSISTEFAVMVALEFLRPPHVHADVSTLLRERFGVSEACMREELDPLIAITIANAAAQHPSHSRNAWLMKTTQHWRPDDQLFALRVTNAFVKSFDAEVYRRRSFSFLLDADFTALPALKRIARERTICLEGPTIGALRNTEKNAEEQIDAFLEIIDYIGDGPSGIDYITILRDIKGLPYFDPGMPLVARPALLHRLVSTAHIGWNERHAADTFICAAVECRNALISGGAQNSPLISRVSAALILVAVHLRKYDALAANAIVTEAGELAFSHAAPEDWGDILQALIYECTLSRPLSVEKWDWIDQHIAKFVCLPNASARHLPELLSRIEAVVGSVWHQLPDKAEDDSSRFEVFRHRIGIRPGKGEIALTSIAKSLVSDIVASVRFLEDVATSEGFDDPDAIGALETTVFELKIRATLSADSDVDAITKQYTKRSLYLRSLIAQAVHDLKIPSDIKNTGA